MDTAVFGQVPGSMATTTREVFVSLLRSFWEAHACILEVGGALSTLTAAVILPLGDQNSGKYIVCACNVGDSLGYVYSKAHGVREFTQGSHDIHTMRDMRDALGALGPVDGNKPELSNLTLSMTIVDAGDIVFITSDGISDNFDPVVGKFAEPLAMEIVAAAAPLEQAKNTPTTDLTAPQLATENYQLASKRQNKSASAIPANNVKRESSNRLRTSKAQKSNSFNEPKPPLRPQRTKKTTISESVPLTTTTESTTNPNVTLPAAITSPPPQPSNRPKFLRSHTVIEPRAAITKTPSIKKFPKSKMGLPLVTGPQRHTLTLLRLEDLLSFGINGTLRPCPSARKLCHLLVDFVRMITSAKRNILEQRELFVRHTIDPSNGAKREMELTKLQQRAARKRVVDGATFKTLPGKLDHASVVAFTVASDLRKSNNRLSHFVETNF